MIFKYYFINKFDTNNINNLDKQTIIIYRNYSSKFQDERLILKIKKFCKKKTIKFYLSNNIKLALKLSEIVFILLEFYGQVLDQYWALSYYETMFAYPINIENGIACHGILKNSSDIFHIGYHINAVCHDPLSLEVSE